MTTLPILSEFATIEFFPYRSYILITDHEKQLRYDYLQKIVMKSVIKWLPKRLVNKLTILKIGVTISKYHIWFW